MKERWREEGGFRLREKFFRELLEASKNLRTREGASDLRVR